MQRLALLCQRHKRLVLGAWILLVVGLSALSGIVGGDVSDDYDLPGSESQRAAEILEGAGFDARAGNQVQVVLATELASTDDRGLEQPLMQARIDAIGEALAVAAPDAEITVPGEGAGAGQVSDDATVGYFTLDLPAMPADEFADLADALLQVRDDVDGDGLQVEVGGLNVEQGEASGPPSEMIGVLAAVAILLLAFGSVFAMVLPILVGIVGAASGVALVAIAARWVDMPSFAAPVAAMIAIGVGIDYALLVVTRYREALATGAPPTEAIVVAQRTAGRSVLFAGVTVVIASLGLVLMDLKLITGVALGIAAAVLVTMLAALTLLPALLAIVGPRIDRLSVRRRSRDSGALARRWSRQVQRHPLAWTLLATTALLAMAVPTLDMRLGFADAGTRPVDDTGRQAYDLLADGFGPGTNGPIVVAASGDSPDHGADVAALADAMRQTEGVASVSPPYAAAGDAGAQVSVFTVVPTTGPRAQATTNLVHTLRDDVIGSTTGDDLEVALGGTTAAAVDFADYSAQRLPLFLGVVLALAMLLLLAVFRGVAVALKAVLVNLLSIGAAFGATVAVFQWGWGVDLLDLGAAGPFEAWAPMMLIAIVFGLSMDYEVFLLSRIKEAYRTSGDNADAVAEGLARTARVITAAAAIMVCVFGSFVLGDSRELQLFGFGLAVAVLIDATLVRMVLVPSLMELLGDRNWWLPRWLDRALPTLDVEGAER